MGVYSTETKSGKDEPDQDLDTLDRRLLAQLGENGRITFAELGRRVGISAAAVRSRVRSMEKAGVITGYRAEIDPVEIGWDVLAFVRVRLRLVESKEEALDLIEDLPGLLECHRLAGRDCFLMKLTAPSVGELESVIDEVNEFGPTETSIVLSSPVPGRPVDAGVSVS